MGSDFAARTVLAADNSSTATGVDWSQITAVKLLGIALAAIFLWWAIKRMFK